MLFDLQGKRKRVIQVVYAFLALLLGVGLVGLGIGGDANGGIFDAIGIGDDGNTGDAQFAQELDDANATLETDPANVTALLTVARYSFLQGQQQLEVDEAGNPALSDDSVSSFEDAITAWEQYLDANKSEKVNDTVASLVLQAYQNLAFSGAQDLVVASRSLSNGVETAEIVAEARPSVTSWLQVATFAYLSGDEKKGEEAGKKALAESTQADREAVEAQLKQLQKQGASIQKQLKDQGPTGEDLENPLGELGAGSSAIAPAGGTSTTPAP